MLFPVPGYTAANESPPATSVGASARGESTSPFPSDPKKFVPQQDAIPDAIPQESAVPSR